MRKSNENSLKEVIDQLLDTYRLKDKLNEVVISQLWESIMGAAIAKRTSSLNIKKQNTVHSCIICAVKTGTIVPAGAN